MCDLEIVLSSLCPSWSIGLAPKLFTACHQFGLCLCLSNVLHFFWISWFSGILPKYHTELHCPCSWELLDIPPSNGSHSQSHRQIFSNIVFFWGFVSHWWSFPLIGWSWSGFAAFYVTSHLQSLWKKKLRAGERIKDETEIASNKEKLIQFVDGHG